MGQTEKRLWTETIICISCQSFRSGFVRIVRSRKQDFIEPLTPSIILGQSKRNLIAGRWRIFNIVDPKESYNGKHESEQRIMLAEWTDAEISKIIYNESINNYCCRWKWIRFCRKGECNTSVWVHRKVNPWAFEIWMFESSLLVAIAAPRGLNSWTVRWASECFFAMYSCYHW